MLERLLRLAHYRVALFASGEDFVASLDRERFDCVVLDIHMPGWSGLDVQRRMKDKGLDMPTVLITAAADFAIDRTAQRANRARLLHKPFSATHLLGAIVLAMSSGAGNA